MKEGSTLWTSTAPPHFSLSLSLSLSLSFSFLFGDQSFLPLLPHGPAVRSILSRRKRVSSGSANNREHVISYSAYHTHYPSIFCPTAWLTRWNLLRGKCQLGRHPARTGIVRSPARRKWPTRAGDPGKQEATKSISRMKNSIFESLPGSRWKVAKNKLQVERDCLRRRVRGAEGRTAPSSS